MKILTLISVFYLSTSMNQIQPNDPGYSLHNYKHTNKAAAIAKRDTNMGVKVSVDDTQHDYKKVGNKKTEQVLKIYVSPTKKSQNYKMPNG